MGPKASILSLACRDCVLNKFCHAHEQQDLPSSLRPVQMRLALRPKQLLCDRNQKMCAFYLVKSGALKASYTDAEGVEHIEHFYLPGEVIGFEALYKKTFPYAITAIKHVELCQIPLNYILQLASFNSLLQFTFMQLMSQRFAFNKNVANFNAEQRVMTLLMDFSRRLSAKGKSEFVLPLSRELMSCYLGLATETVSRILMKLHREKFIEINRRRVKILHPLTTI